MALFFTKSVAPTGGGGNGTAKQFHPGRALVAVVLLAVIFIAGIYCAHDEKLAQWSTVLLHSFEVLLGGLVGMIVGESAS
jgi:hypothetical protein